MATKKKQVPVVNSTVKQQQGGCPAKFSGPGAPPFTGYDHSLTPEEKERMEKKQTAFWKSRNIKP